MDVRGFVAEYAATLADLTFNARHKIDALRELAWENQEAALSIAAAIENRILTALPEEKLPSLYLLDSIVKHEYLENKRSSTPLSARYGPMFARNLAQVYFAVWDAAPQSQAALEKLRRTWDGLFPPDTLAAIDRRLDPVSALSTSYAPNAAGGNAFLAAAPPNGTQLASTLSSLQQYLAPQQQAYLPSSAPLTYQQPQPQVQVQYQHQLPVHQPNAVQQVYAPAPLQTFSVPVQPAQPAAIFQPAPQPQPQVQQPAYVPAWQQPQQAGPRPMYSVAQQQQQQQQQPQPQQRQPTPPLPVISTGVPAAGQLPPAASTPPPVDLMATIMGLLSTPLANTLLAGTAPSAAAVSVPEGEKAPTRKVPTEADMTFRAEKLKAHNPAALAELMAGSARTRGGHLDRSFLRRRRAATASSASRRWYQDLNTWLAGTTVDASAPPSFFEEMALAEPVQKQQWSVPVDDSQPTCALSGEKFETFWDDKTEEWRYRDAKSLDAEEAARYGLSEGTLVLVSSLGAPAEPNILDQDTGADEAAELAADLARPDAAPASPADVKPELGTAVEAAAIKQEVQAAVTQQTGAVSSASIAEPANGGDASALAETPVEAAASEQEDAALDRLSVAAASLGETADAGAVAAPPRPGEESVAGAGDAVEAGAGGAEVAAQLLTDAADAMEAVGAGNVEQTAEPGAAAQPGAASVSTADGVTSGVSEGAAAAEALAEAQALQLQQKRRQLEAALEAASAAADVPSGVSELEGGAAEVGGGGEAAAGGPGRGVKRSLDLEEVEGAEAARPVKVAKDGGAEAVQAAVGPTLSTAALRS